MDEINDQIKGLFAGRSKTDCIVLLKQAFLLSIADKTIRSVCEQLLTPGVCIGEATMLMLPVGVTHKALYAPTILATVATIQASDSIISEHVARVVMAEAVFELIKAISTHNPAVVPATVRAITRLGVTCGG